MQCATIPMRPNVAVPPAFQRVILLALGQPQFRDSEIVYLPRYPGVEFYADGRIRRTATGEFIAENLITAGTRVSGITLKSRTGEYHRRSKAGWIAFAFYGERPRGLFCCHNNGIHWEDRISNLRYDTPEGNSRDRFYHVRCRGLVRPDAVHHEGV